MPILTHSRGRTKASCECGAQSPRFSDESFNLWKRSEEGKRWFSQHNPHGKTRKVQAGGTRTSIDESLKKIESKRSKASSAELNGLAEHFEGRR